MAQSPADTRAHLVHAVGDFVEAARIPAKQRRIKINGTTDRLCSLAYEFGLPRHLLDTVVDAITGEHELDQSNCVNIIRHLYPAERVSDRALIKVVGSLGHGELKLPWAAQVALLKWLVLVYDVLERPKTLSHLYSVIFNLVHTSPTRAAACHLLSLITRRQHVRPFRIQMLIELAQQTGNEPPLVGLIRVYRDYYPDVIVGTVGAGRAAVFTHPDTEWRDRLREIQEAFFDGERQNLPAEQQSFRVNRQGVRGVRRTKTLPFVHTSRAQESSVTLEEIEDVDAFVAQLEKIQLPNQLVAVIGDPLLQKLLLLKSADDAMHRVESWLLAFFEDQLADPQERIVMEMLQALCDYARFTKTLPLACLRYLESLMGTWDGVTGREVMLDLLTHLPLRPFQELYDQILQPVERAILDGTTESQIVVLDLYTNLLEQWTITLLAARDGPPTAKSALAALIAHANMLTLTILQGDRPLSSAAHPSILSFYERATFLFSSAELPAHVRITIPPASLIYTLHFSSSLATLSRLCGVLARYKRSFETAVAQQNAYPKEYVSQFNGYLMDVCNCIWRGRAFNTADPNALGCMLPAALGVPLEAYVARLDVGASLAALFSLSFAPVLCRAAIACVRAREDAAAGPVARRHAGPVTQRSLAQLGRDGGLVLPWAAYRLAVLQGLEQQDVKGVSELMYNTMKHLMSSRERG